mmetsp:Transcript_55556/g.104502  ORF Transcript_55556/g.104502 Transcript_55556/m.104502 type:complete len:262 (-) Transcript_55556:159-944(-)
MADSNLLAGLSVLSELVDDRNVIRERFSGLERQIELENKARRGVEESAASAIRSTLQRLEETLENEVSNRSEANMGLKDLFDSKAATLQDKLEELFLERFDQVHSTIDSLNERMGHVEKAFVQSRERYIREVEDNSVQVTNGVAMLRSAMQSEVEFRRERETSIATKLLDVEARAGEKLATTVQMCEQKFQQMYDTCQESRHSSEVRERRMQARVIEEVSSLKNNLVVEKQAREQADDDIVNALNHYTKALQGALRGMNKA